MADTKMEPKVTSREMWIAEERLTFAVRIACACGGGAILAVAGAILFGSDLGWWIKTPVAVVGVAGVALSFLAATGRRSPAAETLAEAAFSALGMA